MSSALWIGTTGLSASTKQMDVIGNNLANSNTIGYKCSEANFASMLSQSMGGSGGGMQVGQGVGVAGVTTQFSQGSFESTGNSLDMAIDGSGYFIVKNTKDDLTYYTRAGSFYLNEDGNITDVSGYLCQGRMFDADGVESTTMRNINLLGMKSKPQETTNFELGMNLDCDLTANDDPNYFSTSQTIYDSKGSKHTLSANFYRSVDLTIEENGKDTIRGLWYMRADIDGGEQVVPDRPWLEFDDNGKIKLEETREIITGKELRNGDDKITVNTKWGALTDADGATYDFDVGDTIVYGLRTQAATANTYTIVNDQHDIGDFIAHIEAADDTVSATIVEGRLAIIDKVTGESTIDINFSNTSTADYLGFGTLSPTNTYGQEGKSTKQNIVFDFEAQNNSWGDEGKINWTISASDAPEVTSYAMDSRVNTMSNDGYPAGLLNSVDVGTDGIITGFFTNGQQQKLARVRTASFNSEYGLSKVGSYFVETDQSGSPSIGNPGEGGLGKLQSHSLEISNTDVAKEFIKMIAAQRAYQSSARIITSTDQMLQELMNIKR